MRRVVSKELLDSANRASDFINNIIAHSEWDDIKNGFVAIRLSDGHCNGTVYESKRDAVRHCKDERRYAFVCFRNLGPNGSNPRELVHFLMWNRDAYKNGWRLSDPDEHDGGPDLVPTAQLGDHYRTSLVMPFAMVTENDIANFKKSLGLI